MPVRTNGTNSDYVGNATYVTLPFSVMVDCQFWGTITGVPFSQLNTAGNWNGYYIAVGGNGCDANTVANNVFTNSTGGNAGVYNGQRWQIGAVWRSTTFRTAFINGQPNTPGTTSSSPANNQDNTLVGAARHNNSVDSFLSQATLYSAWVWKVELDQSDFVMMARGHSPLTIRPASLAEGWNFGGVLSGFRNPFIGENPGGQIGIISGITFTGNNIAVDPTTPTVLRKNAVLNRLTQPVSQIGSFVYAKAVNRAVNW